MRYLITCFFFLFFQSFVFAQDVTLQWARSFGSPANDYGKSIAVDNEGNVYTTGQFTGTIDFDPSPNVYNLTSAGSFDIFISKLDKNGDFVWARRIGGTRTENGVSIFVDKSGYVYYGGSFGSTVDFDPGPGVFNLSTIDDYSSASCISKLDPQGNFIWAKKIDLADVSAITVDPMGNVFATGDFFNIADFDPGSAVYNLTQYGYTGLFTGISDVFVLKLDANGNFIWVRQMGGKGVDIAIAISVDPTGNIITTGNYSSTGDFDPGPGNFSIISNGGLDIFISKLDLNGNFVYAKSIGGNNDDHNRSLAIDATGNLYLGGYFAGTADFDPGPTQYILSAHAYAGDFSVCKLDVNGQFAWAKNFGGIGEGLCLGLTVDAASNVYTTGCFTKTIDFDPGAGTFNLSAKGYQDVFISKLDNEGNFLWAKTFGSYNNDDAGFAITVDKENNIYTTGYFWGMVDFDPEAGIYNLGVGEYGDIFIQKLTQCQNITYSTVKATACNSYSLNNKTYSTSGIYKQTIKNVFGCDSIITLQLTISGTITSNYVTACESYNWQGKSYTNSGAYTIALVGANGCDSLLHLDLIINKRVTTYIQETICDGQNYFGYTAAGTYRDTLKRTNGCDSIRTLELLVIPKIYSTVNTSICEGEGYFGHTKSGTYIDTFNARYGCDSIRTLNLIVNQRKFFNTTVSICEGASYFVGKKQQTKSGIYTDTLSSFAGCDSIIITQLVVIPKPNVYLGRDRDLCKGDVVNLNPGKYDTYLWQDGSKTSQINIQQPGVYWVKVTNGPGCFNIDTLKIGKLIPLPSGFLKKVDSVCQYETLKIEPLKSFQEYVWSTGSQQQNIKVGAPGIYWLMVKDMNGCMGRDSITIWAKQCLEGLYIPTAFTPNGDGKNDLLRPLLFGNVKQFHFVVYNRWGEKVFETTSLQKGWDGKGNKNDYDSNVFTWICQYQFEGQSLKFEKGTVVIIR